MIANLCSWEQNDNSRVWEVRFFCGAAKPTWWRWNYFGRELCFVNQLLHSWFHDSFCWLKEVNNKFNYMYEQIYFPLCEWYVMSYYTYIYIYIYVCMYVCIHLSNDALFGECISRKKLLSFFISKLMEFSFKNWNSRVLEWWYHSDKAGRYIYHQHIFVQREYLEILFW